MYNESRKCDYISSHNIRADSQKFLQRISESEESLSKDACDFTVEEAKTSIGDMGLTSMCTAKNVLCLLRDYTDWCIEQGYAKGNPYYDIKIDDSTLVANIGNRTLSGYDEVSKFFDSVFRPLDDDAPDNSYRTCLWLVFFGFSVEEVEKLTVDDYNNGVISAFGKEVDLNGYPEAKASIDHSISQATSIWGKYSKVLPASNHIVRCFGDRSNFAKLMNVKAPTLIRRANKTVGTPMYSITDIARTGLFYRMYEAEKASGVMGMNKVANDYIYANRSVTRNGNPDNSRVKENMKRIMSEYRAWKGTLDK